MGKLHLLLITETTSQTGPLADILFSLMLWVQIPAEPTTHTGRHGLHSPVLFGSCLLRGIVDISRKELTTCPI